MVGSWKTLLKGVRAPFKTLLKGEEELVFAEKEGYFRRVTVLTELSVTDE